MTPEDIVRLENEERQRRMAAGIHVAQSGRSAQQVAHANKLAQQLNIPAPLVESDPKPFEDLVKREQADTMLDEHPWMTPHFLENPDTAAMLQSGDFNPLGNVSRLLSSSMLRSSPLDQRSRPVGYVPDIKLPKDPAKRVPWKAKDYAIKLPKALLGAFGSAVANTAGIVMGGGENILDIVGLDEELDPYFRQQEEFARQTQINMRGDWGDSGWQADVFGGVASTIQMLLPLPFGKAAILPTFAAATYGNAYTKYQGRDAGVGASMVGASLEGVIEYTTERSPIGYLTGGRLGKDGARNFLSKYVLKDVLGEQLATLGQDAVDTAIANPDKTWGQYIEERPERFVSTLISTLTTSAIVGGGGAVMRRFSKTIDDTRMSVEAMQGQALLDQIMTNAEAAPLRKLSPQDFAETVDAGAKDTPVRHVYIPVEAIDAALASEETSPEDKEALVFYQSQIEEARLNNSEVVIPIGEAAARFAGTKVWQTLREDARVLAGGISGREAKANMDGLIEELEKVGTEAFEEAKTLQPQIEAKAAVYDEVKAQVLAAKRPMREAQTTALLVASRAETLASARYGKFKDAKAAWDWMKLEIKGPAAAPAKGKARKVAQSAVVNIGLNVNDGSKITVEEAIAALKSVGIDVTSQEIRESNTEPTLIAALSREPTPEESTAVSAALRQDAIAVRTKAGGALYGPQAEAWGPFNPDYFLDFTPAGQVIPEDGAGFPIEDVLVANGNDPMVLQQFGGMAGAFADPEIFGARWQAQDLEADGATPEEIWEKTGWMRGPDNQWRFEIADDEAQMVRELSTQGLEEYELQADGMGGPYLLIAPGVTLEGEKLGDLLKHPTLFKHYPGLKHIKVYASTMLPKNEMGFFEPRINSIVLNGNLSKAENLSTLLHEVQHAVQIMEGFAGGATAAPEALRGMGLGDVLDAQIAHLKEINKGNVPGMRFTEARTPVQLEATAAFMVYERVAGEVEARNTQSRRTLNLDQRRQLFPDLTADIDRENVLLPTRETGTVSASTAASNEVFYSALERAIEATSTKRASAAQWMATLRKTPGVRQEELEWSGLKEWLEGPIGQSGPVSREDLLALLKNGGIQVEEVVLGDFPTAIKEQGIQRMLRDMADEGWDRERAELEWDSDPDQRAIEGDFSPQFKTWSSDPSNDTYRELLITLPPGAKGNPERAPSTHWDVEGVVAHARFMEKTDADGKRVLFVEEVQSDWHQKGRDQGYRVKATPEQLEAARQEHIAAKDVEARALRDFVEKVNALVKEAKAKNYPQAVGLKPPSEADFWYDRRKYANAALDKLGAGDLGSIEPGLFSDAVEAGKALDRAELHESEVEQRRMNAEGQQGIPDAPFKSTWPALVMKRVIRWAVDNGFDKVAWTTGEEQAERYNLSTATGDITIAPEYETVLRMGVPGQGERVADTYRVMLGSEAATRAMRQQFNLTYASGHTRAGQLRLTADQMREAFGSDLTKRLIETAEGGGGGTLSGDDLRVGGEGMKAFYDRNLVNITNDIIKKYGAKVGPVAIVEGREPSVEVRLKRGFEITDKLREAASSGFALFQDPKTPRGEAMFYPDGRTVIQLFKADFSTMLHELSHVFLEQEFKLAADKKASPELKADIERLKKWFADNNAPIGKDGKIPVAAHELFARTGERYFREGKAPSAELRGAFKQFREWLTGVYKTVKALLAYGPAPINPEISEIFDRMIATGEAIEANATTPMSQEELGMSTAEYDAYLESVNTARDTAHDALLERMMKAIRRREQTRGREQRAIVKAEISDTVKSDPRFIALHLLRTGRWLNDPDKAAVRVKLNTGWLIDNYGEDVLKKLPVGLQPLHRGDGQVGDEVAEMVGIDSGDALVRALIELKVQADQLKAEGNPRPLMNQIIEDATDAEMAARHGDIAMSESEIEEEAIGALNSARQGEVLATELRQLKKLRDKSGVVTPYQLLREWARRKVNEGSVADAVSKTALQRYIRGFNKARNLFEEAILGGNRDEAIKQKQAQMINHALLAEGKKVADEIDAIVRRMQRYARTKALASIDQDYMDRIHELLEGYNFKPVSDRARAEQASFEDWAARQRETGHEVYVPPRYRDQRTNWKDAKVAKLLELNDMVQSLAELGKLKQRLTTALEERTRQEIIDDAESRILSLPERALPDASTGRERKPFRQALREAKTLAEYRRTVFNLFSGETARDAAAGLVKIEGLVDILDGTKDATGPLNRTLIQPATEAANIFSLLTEEVMAPIIARYKSMSRKQAARLRDFITIPELTLNVSVHEADTARLGQPLTIPRMRLVGLLLNTGNLSNLSKLVGGERWGDPESATDLERVRNILISHANKEDLDLVQDIWDGVSKLWPHIVRVEREMSGIVPEAVVPTEFDTPYGPYSGGYWPVVWDSSRSEMGQKQGEEAEASLEGVGFTLGTPKGHTITRTGAVAPMEWSVEAVLFGHLTKVISRIAYAPWIRDALKIIDNPRIKGAIRLRLGDEYLKAIRPWIRDQIPSNVPDVAGAKTWEKFLNQTRINMSIAVLGISYTTGVAQTLGLSYSAGVLGEGSVKAGGYWMGRGMAEMIKLEKNGLSGAQEFVFARSEEMRRRVHEVNQESAEVFRRLRDRDTLYHRAQAASFWHIGFIDLNMVAIPTWLGGYHKALSEGRTEEEAIAYGEKMVRLSQSSGRKKDLSAIQRGNAGQKFIAMFYTPSSVFFNQQWEAAQHLKAGNFSKALAPTFWFLVVTTLAEAMMSGDWPEDDEEDGIGGMDITEWVGRNLLFGAFYGVPVVRDITNAAERKLRGEYAEYGNTPLSTAASMIERGVKSGGKFMRGEETEGKDLKSVVGALGFLFGLPGNQIGKTSGFIKDVREGRAQPETAGDWLEGLAYGKLEE